MIKRWTVSLLFLLLLAMPIMAQGGGQICVRAYEDRNQNGQEDPGEPRITVGLTAFLLNADNVIINSQFMEDSPNAASGTLCFQRLEAGQYTLRVASANYSDTTPNEFITAITGSGVPQVFNYGGSLIISERPGTTSDDLSLTNEELRLLLERVFLAGIGAVLVIGAMAVMGALVAFIFFRDPPPPRPRRNPQTTQRLYTQAITGSTENMQPISVPRRTITQDVEDVFTPQTDTDEPQASQPMRSPMVEPQPDPDINPIRPDNFLDDFQFSDDESTNNPRGNDSPF